jgi:hypothetical protein
LKTPDIKMPSITFHQIDSLLPFLDRFEAADFSAGTWNTTPGQMPWFDYAESVNQFQKALYDNGWIKSFDWTNWQDTAIQYVKNPHKIEAADAETIQKLFTTHIRKDRFCEGHLAAMIENRHIVALLRRLKNIRAG